MDSRHSVREELRQRHEALAFLRQHCLPGPQDDQRLLHHRPAANDDDPAGAEGVPGVLLRAGAVQVQRQLQLLRVPALQGQGLPPAGIRPIEEISQ